MGLKLYILQDIEEDILKVHNSCKDLKMLELGDQIIRPKLNPAKEYWQTRGFIHTSVDVNGKHGSIVKDLSVFDQFVD